MYCLMQCRCRYILYNQKLKKCHLFSQGWKEVNLNEFDTYKLFVTKEQEICQDLCIGVTTPKNWTSSCPVQYFALDFDTGTKTARGPEPENIDFTAEGVVGNAFYNPTTTSSIVKAYLDLGVYLLPEFCFTDPQSCEHGTTFSFWLMIVGPTEPDNYGQVNTYKSHDCKVDLSSEKKWSYPLGTGPFIKCFLNIGCQRCPNLIL